MKGCNNCGRANSSYCEKCSHSYSDMYIPQKIEDIEKHITIGDDLFGFSQITYITGKIPEGREKDWAIDKYNDDKKTRFVIAFLRWDRKNECYDVESVGTRLCEYGNTELLRWIKNLCEELGEINEEEGW